MRSQAINDFKDMILSRKEMGNIFLPDKRIFCRSCQKIRLKKKISRDAFSTKHKKKICFCDTEIQQHVHPPQINNDNMPIINPVGQMNEIVIDNFQNVENNEEVIDHSVNLGNNNAELESEIGQIEQVDNGMDIEQNSDENDFVTRKELNVVKYELKDELKALSEQMNNRFDEIMKKIDKKADK